MAPCEVTDDYYMILEITQNATLEEVKKSYRRLALALHPDRNPDKPDATASFQCVCLSHLEYDNHKSNQSLPSDESC